VRALDAVAADAERRAGAAVAAIQAGSPDGGVRPVGERPLRVVDALVEVLAGRVVAERGADAGRAARRLLTALLTGQSMSGTRAPHDALLETARKLVALAGPELWPEGGDALDPLQAVVVAYADEEGEDGEARALELVRVVLSRGVPRALRAARNSGYTALHMAAEASRAVVLRELLGDARMQRQCASALAARSKRAAETPLDVARRNRHFPSIKALSLAMDGEEFVEDDEVGEL